MGHLGSERNASAVAQKEIWSGDGALRCVQRAPPRTGTRAVVVEEADNKPGAAVLLLGVEIWKRLSS